MAQITIRERFTIDGTLTNVTSVVLNDPTSTYGVKRDDTDAIVVAAGTALTNVSIGVYEYEFEEPTSGLTYTYYVEYVYGGNTYRVERFITGGGDLDFHSTANWMTKEDIVDWLKQEFGPLTLATPDATLRQIVDNAVRYWNTHSGYKLLTMVSYATGQKRVQLDKQYKQVVDVIPGKTTTWIWNDHPLWTMLGVTIIDNITADLIMMSEAFRNYRIYVGTDMRWEFIKSDDPNEGGWLYMMNLPKGSDAIAVVGTKRITSDETIKTDYILNWILDYAKALLQRTEGNTLRKASIIGVQNDGDKLVDEGTIQMKELQEKLETEGRWVALIQRG